MSKTFRVTVLGSSAAIPTQNRGSASQWVECNNRSILIDCGEGTQVQIRKFGIHLQRISFILISHLHGDHYLGLPGLLSTMNLLGRTRGIKVFGPAALKEVLDLSFKVGGAYVNFGFEFIAVDVELRSLIFEDNAIKIWAFPLHHRIECYGYSIEEKVGKLKINEVTTAQIEFKPEHFQFLTQGIDFEMLDGRWIDHKKYTIPSSAPRIYSYCSDTKPHELLAERLAGTTTLYHEATFLESEIDRARLTFHSTAAQAADLAKSIHVNKLLLGHLSSRYTDGLGHEQEAQPIFEQTEVVEDGSVYPII